jgi:hypothetical protein
MTSSLFMIRPSAANATMKLCAKGHMTEGSEPSQPFAPISIVLSGVLPAALGLVAGCARGTTTLLICYGDGAVTPG